MLIKQTKKNTQMEFVSLEELKDNLPEIVAEYCDKTGATRVDIAKACGWKRQQLNKRVKGKQPLTRDTAERILGAMGIKVVFSIKLTIKK